MFGSFSRDDSGLNIHHISYRMVNYKHNPYIGTFHSINRNEPSNNRQTNVIDSKNPLLPMFRHAPPAQVIAGVGLKSLLFEDINTLHLKPFVSQVQVSERVKQAKKHLTSDALKHLPLSIFDLSSSPNSLSDNDLPICSICLDCFKDGDELRTLECSHCYHRHCIDIWLIGCLSDELTDTCNCPQCRQAIGTNLTQSSSDIPSAVFLRIGQSLSNVESVSDITSDNDSIQETSINGNNNENGNIRVDEDDDEDGLEGSPILDDLSTSESILFDDIDNEHDNEHDNDNEHNSGRDSSDNDMDGIEQATPLCESGYSDCGFPLV